MKKFINFITILFFGFSGFSQIKSTEVDTQRFVFPMKGDFIYYSLAHTMSNTKHDLKYYLSPTNSEFNSNFYKKSSDNYFASFLNGNSSCIIRLPQIGTNGTMKLSFTGGNNLLEGSLLHELLTIKKFKVSSVNIDITLKLELNGEDGYTLSFTNFVITYYGTQGLSFKQETLDLEAVYNEIKENQKLDGKMYDKSAKNLMEIDKFVYKIDGLFYTELNKAIRMDN